MKIIAFDSGIERTGFAVFTLNGSDHTLESYGCITTSRKESVAQRLHTLQERVISLVKENKPEVFVIEQLFFTVNQKTVIAVAQAQGAVIAIAGKNNIDIEYLSPPQIKQSIAGYGNADKKSVQKMVAILLNMDKPPEPDDTADAIACGLTYCTMRTFNDRQTSG